MPGWTFAFYISCCYSGEIITGKWRASEIDTTEDVIIDDCHFRDLSSAEEGGAIACAGLGQIVRINRCTFVECRARGLGGGIAFFNTQECQILSCCASRCDASRGAFGALALSASNSDGAANLEVDLCQVTRCSPKLTPDQPEDHRGAFLFHAPNTLFGNSNITLCNAIEDTFGSIFASQIEGLIARRGIFLDSGGVYVAAAASIVVEECVMIAEGQLCPCITYEKAFCDFRFCEFHGAVVFHCNGSIESSVFHDALWGLMDGCEMATKKGVRLEKNWEVIRISLSDMRSCPGKGAYFSRRCEVDQHAVPTEGIGLGSDVLEERKRHWLRYTVVVLAAGLFVVLL
jgi:hypothetical protein